MIQLPNLNGQKSVLFQRSVGQMCFGQIIYGKMEPIPPISNLNLTEYVYVVQKARTDYETFQLFIF